MDNQKHERKFEELELQTAQIFSQKFLKRLQERGYRPGVDKLELSTNFRTEFTIIRHLHDACYAGGLVKFFLLKIPDKYKPKNRNKKGNTTEESWSESLALEEIFAQKILETLESLGCNDSSRLRFSTNYKNHTTTIVYKKTVLEEDYFDVIIPDQVREWEFALFSILNYT